MFPPPSKKAVVIAALGITNGATSTGILDRKDFDSVTIDVYMSTSNNATNKPSTLKVSEADDTNATSFSDVTAFVGGTAFTIPSAPTATTSPLIYSFGIDCRSRKRYLKVSVTPLTTQDIIALANLFRGKASPVNAADANVQVLAVG